MKKTTKNQSWHQSIIGLFRKVFSPTVSIDPLEEAVTKEAIEKFLSEWKEVKKTKPQSVTKHPPQIWLKQEDQRTYLTGLQEQINEDFLKNDLSFLEAMLYKNNAKASHSGLYEWAERTAILKGNGVRAHNRLTQLKDAGFDIDGWYKEYRSYTKDLQKYFNARIRNHEIERQLHAIEAGVRGEKAMERELENLDRRYVVLRNVRIEADLSEQNSAESDAIVVSRHGIFTIEAKNYAEKGEYEVNVSKDGEWTVRYIDRNGKKHEYETKDVIAQSENHVTALEDLLNREMKKRGHSEENTMKVDGMIVFTNNVVEVFNHSNYPIMRIKGMKKHMRKFRKPLSDEQVDQVVEILRENMLPPAEFPMVDYKREYTHVVKNYKHMEKAMTMLQELVGYDKAVQAKYHANEKEVREEINARREYRSRHGKNKRR